MGIGQLGALQSGEKSRRRWLKTRVASRMFCPHVGGWSERLRNAKGDQLLCEKKMDIFWPGTDNSIFSVQTCGYPQFWKEVSKRMGDDLPGMRRCVGWRSVCKAGNVDR